MNASQIELVCPAGSLPALKTAIDHGADCVYLGFKDATNARNFSGLNFDPPQMREGIAYAHARGKKVLLVGQLTDISGNLPLQIFFAIRTGNRRQRPVIQRHQR